MTGTQMGEKGKWQKERRERVLVGHKMIIGSVAVL